MNMASELGVLNFYIVLAVETMQPNNGFQATPALTRRRA